MARLLASSRYATDLLLRAPETVAMLGDDAQLAARPARRAAGRGRRGRGQARRAPTDAVAAVRALRRRELLRTAAADLLGLSAIEETGEALTAVTAVDHRAPRWRSRSDVERERTARCPPGCAWWPWAGSAGTRPATAATPT